MVIRGRGNGEGEEGGNIYAVSTKGVNRARLTSEGTRQRRDELSATAISRHRENLPSSTSKDDPQWNI